MSSKEKIVMKANKVVLLLEQAISIAKTIDNDTFELRYAIDSLEDGKSHFDSVIDEILGQLDKEKSRYPR